MFYVYIIRSIKCEDQIYIGFTENIKRRIKEHNIAENGHTAKHKPWKLIHVLVFFHKKKALDFETYLKTSSGKAFMRKRLI